MVFAGWHARIIGYMIGRPRKRILFDLLEAATMAVNQEDQMNDDRLEFFQAEVAEGSLHKGFLVVSKSNYWTPWMMRPVQHRVEIGLFEEYLGYPRSPAFSLNWTTDEYETRVEIRAPAEAWRLLPLLDGLADVLIAVGASVDDGALSVSDVQDLLEEAGFAESKWEYPEADQLPLPPEEVMPPAAPELGVRYRSGGLPCERETRWIGPHIGRTARFLGLVENFVAHLNEQGVAAQDVKAEYTDSAFHRLWECIDYDRIDQSFLEASGRSSALDVPIALTDTRAYLATALWKGEEGFIRSGGYEGAPELTLLAPISQISFQLYEAKEGDFPRMENAFRSAAEAVGLEIEWDEQMPVVRLPDTSQYRDHTIQP